MQFKIIEMDDIYFCQDCNAVFSHKKSLIQHVQSEHELKCIEYTCNSCAFKSSKQMYLKLHQQYKHEDIMYVWNQCDYEAITNNCLKIHSLNHHDTDHKSTEVNFNLHKKFVNDDKNYYFNLCNNINMRVLDTNAIYGIHLDIVFKSKTFKYVIK